MEESSRELGSSTPKSTVFDVFTAQHKALLELSPSVSSVLKPSTTGETSGFCTPAGRTYPGSEGYPRSAGRLGKNRVLVLKTQFSINFCQVLGQAREVHLSIQVPTFLIAELSALRSPCVQKRHLFQQFSTQDSQTWRNKCPVLSSSTSSPVFHGGSYPETVFFFRPLFFYCCQTGFYST